MGVSGDDRQIIYLHLPCLPIRRMARVQGWSLQEKVGLYQREKGTDRLVYLSAEAGQTGFGPDYLSLMRGPGILICALRQLTTMQIRPY